MMSTAILPICSLSSSTTTSIPIRRVIDHNRLSTAPLSLPTSQRRLRHRLRHLTPRSKNSDSDADRQEQPVSNQDGDPSPSIPEGAEEIKEKLAEARARPAEDQGFWGGVAEEVGEVEWPVFGKVLGTTGVVLSVIVGSSIALLTVNAVLAEISDRVFAGKGVQDFFS